MFTSKNLFSDIICPYKDTCMLPRCLFKHPVGTEAEAKANIGQQVSAATNGQEGQRKRQKLLMESLEPDTESRSLSSARPEASGVKSSKPLRAKQSQPPQPATAPRKSSLANRPISPPPRKEKQKVKPPSSTKPSLHESPRPKVLQKEPLNPRVVAQSPETHTIRYTLVQKLQAEFARLNTGLAKDAKDDEEELVLSEQALITRVLDLEEAACASKPVYRNIMTSKVMMYKKMSVQKWVEERREEVEKEKAALVQAKPKMSGPPKVIDTGLNAHEELALLYKIYTPITEKEAKHGYITAIPSEEDVKKAKAGVDAAGGQENCDRCTRRFQVFPERRLQDGALASNGPCTYHHGKLCWRDRNPAEPKAPRTKYWTCCAEDNKAPGCTKAENHVFKITEAKRLASVLQFAKTPNNTNGASSVRPVCIDGEMCYTVHGFELCRLTATQWPCGTELFDVLVRPIGLILDLNSRYSGVWPEDMAKALPYHSTESAKLMVSEGNSEDEDIKPKLRIVPSPAAARELLFTYLNPATPLVGHGLENDMIATRMIHPTIIDTALLFPHKQGLPYRRGLKALMQEHLNRQIQIVRNDSSGKPVGHDSKEDANAAGDLVRLALALKWKELQRLGWTKDGKGDFVRPIPKNASGDALVGRDAPLKILSGASAGFKRSREEVDTDSEDKEGIVD